VLPHADVAPDVITSTFVPEYVGVVAHHKREFDRVPYMGSGEGGGGSGEGGGASV